MKSKIIPPILIKSLDDVLEILEEMRDNKSDIKEIEEKLKSKNINIAETDLKLILNQLVHENYIMSDITGVPMFSNSVEEADKSKIKYQIKYEGLLFNATGAYSGRYQDKARIRVLETYPDILNRRTGLLVLATFSLGLIELLKWCYDNHWFPFLPATK